eukprot:scaffold63283_cov39-Prasinocladus_malaysianus.AAC.1
MKKQASPAILPCSSTSSAYSSQPATYTSATKPHHHKQQSGVIGLHAWSTAGISKVPAHPAVLNKILADRLYSSLP